MSVNRCEFCRHAGPPRAGTVDRECRRFPPVPVVVVRQGDTRILSTFPAVNPAQGCGEWASRLEVPS